jgi:hypothetical protein
MPNDPPLTLLFDRIRRLLGQYDAGGPSRELPEVEHTLTDGYASALTLEGERWRIERKIADLALRLNDPDEAQELHALAVRLSSADAELTRLRGLLVALREHADALRAGVPVAG